MPTSGHRVALLSIRGPYAEAILTGTKTIELRKRPLAADVTDVLLYATLPVGQIVGAFTLAGVDADRPHALWERHHDHAGVSHDAFRTYYAHTPVGFGLLVTRPRRLERPVPLGAVHHALRAPQSFRYLPPPGTGSPTSALERLYAALELSASAHP